MTLACVYHSTETDQQMYIPTRQEDAENFNWNGGGMVESESPTEMFLNSWSLTSHLHSRKL